MVRVDQAGQDDMAAFEIEHFIGLGGQGVGGARLFDEAVAHEDGTVADLIARGVHSHERVTVLDE
jgi:hypothetical protein